MDAGERHVAFAACFNFRDLGGYETLDGRRIRSGCVFRSDTLQRLTPADTDRLKEMGLRTVIDLRATDELAREGRFPAVDHADFVHVPVFEEADHPFKVKPGDPEPPPGEHYLAIATAGAASFATALQVIAERDHAVVFHCMAGKDRTGILAALLLGSLGVPDDVIVTDYQLSDRSVEPADRWARANDPKWAAWLDAAPPWLLRAHPHEMQAFLDRLRLRHGSIDGYLTDAGVNQDVVDALRARLLR